MGPHVVDLIVQPYVDLFAVEFLVRLSGKVAAGDGGKKVQKCLREKPFRSNVTCYLTKAARSKNEGGVRCRRKVG